MSVEFTKRVDKALNDWQSEKDTTEDWLLHNIKDYTFVERLCFACFNFYTMCSSNQKPINECLKTEYDVMTKLSELYEVEGTIHPAQLLLRHKSEDAVIAELTKLEFDCVELNNKSNAHIDSWLHTYKVAKAAQIEALTWEPKSTNIAKELEFARTEIQRLTAMMHEHTNKIEKFNHQVLSYIIYKTDKAETVASYKRRHPDWNVRGSGNHKYVWFSGSHINFIMPRRGDSIDRREIRVICTNATTAIVDYTLKQHSNYDRTPFGRDIRSTFTLDLEDLQGWIDKYNGNPPSPTWTKCPNPML